MFSEYCESCDRKPKCFKEGECLRAFIDRFLGPVYSEGADLSEVAELSPMVPHEESTLLFNPYAPYVEDFFERDTIEPATPGGDDSVDGG